VERAAVIGLDGAAWHLLDPLIDKGTMPRLASLRERGASGTLVSTVPTYTPPAWTSAATGVNPGRHGIYGFIEGHAQHEQKLVHSGRIRSATIWEMANRQNAKAGIYNLPLTYPPRELDGWMVSGMLTPGYGEKQQGFAYPNAVEPRILEVAPDYVLDVHANYETDWRDAGLAQRALASIEQRYKVLEMLLQDHPVDVLFSVLEAPDRLQHVYYRYMDPSDPASGKGHEEIVEGLERCFGAMDRIVGLLDDWAGGRAVVCSDHGFTAWEVSVHLNTLLQEWGYLKIKPVARAMQSKAARAMVPIAKRVLPRKVARGAKEKTFGAIDWSQTRAFASPIPQQGLFVNLQGREPQGIVPPAELETLKSELAKRLATLQGPDGKPVTDHIYLSQDVFHGDALEGAPDVLPVMRDHRYELDDELFHNEPFTDVSRLPRGVHHPNGIVIVSGPGVKAGGDVSGTVMDVTPTLLYLAGLAVPEGLDGGVLADAFEPQALRDRPIETTSPLSSVGGDEASPYSPEEEAIIEESLRGLGYL
jgi:predicted AlkP superfamily phosphohydrolase/phosphomutase